MGGFRSISLPVFSLVAFLFQCSSAARVTIRNNCADPIWPATWPGGGGIQLNNSQIWTVSIIGSGQDARSPRVWARTGCNFDNSGRGRCQTGDCDGRFDCVSFGKPPNTIVEFTFSAVNNMDFFDISLVDGFNVPLEVITRSSGCSTPGIRCTEDIKGQCLDELKAPGGCNNPCTVFQTSEYCCTNGTGSCKPTNYSMFFKTRCPDAYSYPQDDQTSLFTCPQDSNYELVFCPDIPRNFNMLAFVCEQ